MLNVSVRKSQLAKFRQWAKENYPLEILSEMSGTREGDRIRIEFIGPPMVGSKATVDYDWEGEIGEAVARYRKEEGLRFIGTIHTHPDESGPPNPSTHDIHSAAHEKEIVWGVCAVWKKNGKLKTDTRFYSSGPIIEVCQI